MTLFWTIFQRFLKILQNLSKGHMNIAKHFLKISIGYQRLLMLPLLNHAHVDWKKSGTQNASCAHKALPLSMTSKPEL